MTLKKNVRLREVKAYREGMLKRPDRYRKGDTGNGSLLTAEETAGEQLFPAAVRGIKQNRPQANSERTAEVSRTANVKSFGKPVYSMGRQPENMQRKLFSPGEPAQIF